MKKSLFAAILALFVWSENSAAQWFAGVKAGTMAVKFDTATVETDPNNAGFLLGFGFQNGTSGLSLEFDVTRSITPGEVLGDDLSANTNGLYLAYRTSQQLYFKIRLGLMKASLSGGDLDEDENGETYGLGLGWRFDQLAMEFEVTSIDDDVNYASLGLVYQFR